MMSKSGLEVVAAPSSVQTQDVIVEDVELEETYEGEEQIEDAAGQENVSLQVEGQSA